MVFHVTKNGCDQNTGTEESPFLTINQAAKQLTPGDSVIVHEGCYNELVRPISGGTNESKRITYEAAPGEHVVIKGSERINNWVRYDNSVWVTTIDNAFFGNYNPYNTRIEGDWLCGPLTKQIHTGEVYLNGKSFYEAYDIDEVKAAEGRTKCVQGTWDDREELISDVEQTKYLWTATVGDRCTKIYANFHEYDPNSEYVEINVREACFFPETAGMNYITVRGFEMCNAATKWAPPTSDQTGLIGPKWSKGWIIENCNIHDSKCSGISLGKEKSTGDNEFSRWGRKPGYQLQMEATFKGRKIGWSKETIGSHIIRNNVIHDCGQTGIVGHMGGAFSQIYKNEIFNISVKHEFYGHELGGIKLHAAVDTYIHNNYIHDCSLGTWMDWQAQGVRISSNIYDRNNRDLMIEVTHGPHLVDNNIFTSPFAFVNAAQGGAYVHNLYHGFMSRYTVLNRATPYHYPHSTDFLGTTVVYGSDDRWYNNIFVAGNEQKDYGTAGYDGAPESMEEYIDWVKEKGPGDVEMFELVEQPAYVNGNAYLNGAKAYLREKHNVVSEKSVEYEIVTEENLVYLVLELPEEVSRMKDQRLDSSMLAATRITEERFENPNGEDIVFDEDILGIKRQKETLAGPIESLKPGKNKVLVWRRTSI